MLDLEKLQKKAPVRQLRVAELIKEVIAQALSQKQFDDALLAGRFISVSKVKISPDLQNATILVTIFPNNNVKEIIEKLNHLSSKFRELVNRNVKLKFSPKILFRFDDTLEEVSRINNLILSINKDK
jgi:ribosome-binding factor A